jgi:hypothetical protein
VPIVRVSETAHTTLVNGYRYMMRERNGRVSMGAVVERMIRENQRLKRRNAYLEATRLYGKTVTK